MPPKRKAKAKKQPEPEITVLPAPPAPPVAPKIISQSTDIFIRCIYDSRLIIGPHITATGRRYEFTTGQIKPVDYQDYPILLAMETSPSGCCGGTVRPQKYFEEVS